MLLLYAHPSHLILAMWWRLGKINILFFFPCCCYWQRAYFVHLENWLWRGELRKKKGNKFRFNPEISALFKSAENPFSLYNFKSSFFYKYGRLFFSYQYVCCVYTGDGCFLLHSSSQQRVFCCACWDTFLSVGGRIELCLNNERSTWFLHVFLFAVFQKTRTISCCLLIWFDLSFSCISWNFY